MSDYKPADRAIDYHKQILSNIDDDIAKPFHEYGYGQYKTEYPISLQICRNIGLLTDAVNSLVSQVKVNGTNNSHCKCRQCKDYVEPNNCSA